MTGHEILARVLSRADADREAGLVTADELREGPADAVEALIDARWLAAAEPAVSITCDACDEGHVEVPEIVRLSERDAPRAYITCPEAGRVGVDLARLRRWRVDPDAVADTVATLLGAGRSARAQVTSRVWRLGSIPAGGRRWQAYLACGVTGPDGRVAAPLRASPSRLVFTFADPAPDPTAGVWLSLDEVLRLERAVFSFDWRELEERCMAARSDSGRDTAVGRPRGRGFGALLDCWMDCKGLEHKHLNPSDAYNVIEAYVLKQHAFRPVPPPRARYPRVRSAARAARANAGGDCIWHRHDEPLPSDLASR